MINILVVYSFLIHRVKNNVINYLVPFVLLFVLSMPAWIALVEPSINLWGMYDARNHIVRSYLLSRAWDNGEWYPRWTSEQYGGYGYPTFNFYAPLVYVVVACLLYTSDAADE